MKPWLAGVTHSISTVNTHPVVYFDSVTHTLTHANMHARTHILSSEPQTEEGRFRETDRHTDGFSLNTEQENTEQHQTDAADRPLQPVTLSGNISGGRRALGLHPPRLELRFSMKQQQTEGREQPGPFTLLVWTMRRFLQDTAAGSDKLQVELQQKLWDLWDHMIQSFSFG